MRFTAILFCLFALAASLSAKQAEVVIREPSDWMAYVSCPSGLSYSVTDYGSVSLNRIFWKNTALLADFRLPREGEFNRLSFEYTSAGPLRMTATYLTEGAPVSDEVFLEAGSKTFSFLIKGWDKGKKAASLRSVALSPLKGSGEAVIRDVKTETVPLPDGDTCYISNGSLKVGVKLLWGGGVSYFEDRRCRIEGLSNLINRADEGRLIQQSYYGDKAGPDYEPGTAFGVRWTYNPVQGGDSFRNPSRLIDFTKKGGSVYIKAQPMDWALDGRITPSYMENTYMLKGNVLEVRNRFVDFSGMEHSVHNQELPAFYTVSYLGRFVCYQGEKPWTGDVLTERDGLPFWGGGYVPECHFEISPSNTESWSAWMSAGEDYGIGLYTPGVTLLVAGRHMYNGSKDPADNATNYTAPLIAAALKPFVPLEYSYLITAGSLKDIRSRFSARKGFADNFAGYK